MTRSSEVPTGDSIAQQLNNRKPGDSLADVARELTDAHAHRPGLFQQDLAAVNKKLHDDGILPGFDIVGINGTDLVTKSTNGVTVVWDSSDLNNHHVDLKPGASTINGREAAIGSDGSGQLTVKAGDNLTTISRDVLKSQGIEAPTNNQIENYKKELFKLNGKQDLAMIHPGDIIKLPPSVKAGAKTEFVDDRANGAEQKATDAISLDYANARAAIDKTQFFGIGGGISKNDITQRLAGSDLTAEQRKGFEFLRDNFDKLKCVNPRDGGTVGAIDEKVLESWKRSAIREAELESFQVRKDD